MYIKIYFSDKPLFLCDAFTDEISRYVHHDDAVFIDEFSNAAVNSMIHEMRQPEVHAGIFYHDKLNELKKAFWKKFNIVAAAGGLVQDKSGNVLFIFRRGKWDLPKGKQDKGESIQDCALREVQEETGLKKLVLVRSLESTCHTYDESGKHFLKETSWFLMEAGSSQMLVPQLEEQITQLKWVPKDQVADCLSNSYPSISDVLAVAGRQEHATAER